MTQKELSISIGRSFRTVQKYESNDLCPPLPMMKKLASVFEVEVNEILQPPKVKIDGMLVTNIISHLKDSGDLDCDIDINEQDCNYISNIVKEDIIVLIENISKRKK